MKLSGSPCAFHCSHRCFIFLKKKLKIITNYFYNDKIHAALVYLVKVSDMNTTNLNLYLHPKLQSSLPRSPLPVWKESDWSSINLSYQSSGCIPARWFLPAERQQFFSLVTQGWLFMFVSLFYKLKNINLVGFFLQQLDNNYHLSSLWLFSCYTKFSWNIWTILAGICTLSNMHYLLLSIAPQCYDQRIKQ